MARCTAPVSKSSSSIQPSMIRSALFSLLGLAFLLSACADNSTGPDVGSGNELTAKINGTEVTFTMQPAIASYDPGTKLGRFGGTTTGNPTRTMTLSFTHDLDNGSFPVTFKDPEISITYIQISGTDTTTTICEPLKGHCTVTLTASNGSIVDGTFAATLTDTKNAANTFEIKGGTFSARLR